MCLCKNPWCNKKVLRLREDLFRIGEVVLKDLSPWDRMRRPSTQQSRKLTKHGRAGASEQLDMHGLQEKDVAQVER